MYNVVQKVHIKQQQATKKPIKSPTEQPLF